MTTATDIINGALRLLQVKSPDVTLTASEANDGLEALNMMLDSWANENLMAYHVVKESFTLVPGQNPYTVGAGGHFDTERPQEIQSATITINGADFNVVPVDYDDWAAIRLKSLQTGYTEYLYLDNTYPIGNIYIYPVSSIASTLTLYSRKPFVQFANLTSPVNLPPGYARCMKYGLAIELGPEYQKTAGDDVKRLFVAAKAGIKRTNKRPITQQCDPALFAAGKQRFNIFRGS